MIADANASASETAILASVDAHALERAESALLRLPPERWRAVFADIVRRALDGANPRAQARLVLAFDLLVKLNALDLLLDLTRDEASGPRLAPHLRSWAAGRSPSLRRLVRHQADIGDEDAGEPATDPRLSSLDPRAMGALKSRSGEQDGFSVVVVAHKRSFLLRRLLASIRALSSRAPVEALIFFNGGPVPRAADVREAIGPAPALRLLHSARAIPVGHARNRLIAEARHDTIVSLDSDMTLLRPVDELVARLDQFPASGRAHVWNLGYLGVRDLTMVKLLKFFEVVGTDPDGVRAIRNRTRLRLNGKTLKAARAAIAAGNRMSGGASVFPKAIFQEIGGYDERFDLGWEDLEWSIRLSASGRLVFNELDIALFHGHLAPFCVEDLAAETSRADPARREAGLGALKRDGYVIADSSPDHAVARIEGEQALRGNVVKLRLLEGLDLPLAEAFSAEPIVAWVVKIDELAAGGLRDAMALAPPLWRNVVISPSEVGALDRLAATTMGVEAIVLGSRALAFLSGRSEEFAAAFRRLNQSFSETMIVYSSGEPSASTARLRATFPNASVGMAREPTELALHLAKATFAARVFAREAGSMGGESPPEAFG